MMRTRTPQMGFVRTLKRNSLFLYIAEIIPRLGAMVIVPLWSARISPLEYGKWVLALTGTEIILAVGNLGLISYMIKVLYRYHDDRANAYFGMSLSIIMAMTSGIAATAACFSPWLSRVLVGSSVRPDLFVYLAIFLVGVQLNNMSIVYVQNRLQYGSSLWLVLFRWTVNMTVMLYCLIIRHQGFYSWVWASLASEVSTLPLSLYFLRHVKWTYFNRRMLSFAFRFSLPTMATQVLGWGQSRVGRYILSMSQLGSAVGLFGVSQNFSQNYGAVVRPVKSVAQQILGHRLEADADSPEFMEFFHFFCCLGLAVAFLSGMFFRDIMKLLIAPAYWGARAALPALVFGLYMEEIFTLYHSLMFRYFKVWFDFSRTLIVFPAVTLATLLLVSRLGVVGAALAQMLGAGIMWLFAHLYAKKVTVRNFRFRHHVGVTAMAFLIAELAYVLRFSLGIRLVVASVALGPYLLYYWRVRQRVFPLLSRRLESLGDHPIRFIWTALWT